jgi:hypothetical protein
VSQYKTSVVVIICAGVFTLDKTIRSVRYAWLSRGTIAAVVLLANGGTHVTLNRSIP